MKVKIRVNWKKVLLFLFISAGLIFLTHSLLMSIGIMLLLFVVDALLANYEYRQHTKAIFDDLRREHEEAEQRNKETDKK
ncbi:MAG: hypothetical protein SPL67_07840 [Prevotella sp.]|nr:hypothetical protein [Prevotella sp.]MDY6242013.1 hypothetical protein [Prevotella sp.]